MWLICEVGEAGKVRQCDARCYEAKRPKCECICKGANHGKGLEGSLRWMWDNLLELSHAEEREELVVNQQVIDDLCKEVFGGAECGVP